jgi:hypothetical protein
MLDRGPKASIEIRQPQMTTRAGVLQEGAGAGVAVVKASSRIRATVRAGVVELLAVEMRLPRR